MEKLLQENLEIMHILGVIEALNLEQGCLCAGTIRNYFWDVFSDQNPQIVSDVDVVFYDPAVPYEMNATIQADLKRRYPQYEWEVKNQVYMHIHNPLQRPYTSVVDALASFPERCTAIGAYLKDGDVHLIAPYGTDDIRNFIIQPTPMYANEPGYSLYRQRIIKKTWTNRWPRLSIL